MKTTHHISAGKRLLPVSIFIQLYCISGLKNLFNKIYTGISLNYDQTLVFGNQQAANEVNTLIPIKPDTISEIKKYFIKKSLCL